MRNRIQVETDRRLVQDLMSLTASRSFTHLVNRALTLLKSVTRGDLGPEMATKAKDVSTEEFIKREYALSHIRLRERIILFLFIVYGFAIGATFLLFFLRGFELISLTLSEMKWLGGAVIGELAGLFAIVIKSVFPK
jgi:hypothetical protein